MFIHGKTGYKYYSVREKINYYKKVINGSINADAKTKRKAKLRLKTLEKLNNRTFDEPTMIITDDKHFGNKISKPRVCVVVKTDDKNRIMVAPLHKRDSQTVILDKNISRQISNTSRGEIRWLDKSDIYETKYLSKLPSLTVYDKNKIKSIFIKK